MRCAWNDLLMVLPAKLRNHVDRLGKQELQELRLRINAPPELRFADRTMFLSEVVNKEDLLFIVNTASRYSPWSAGSITNGYLTIAGGHRIGLCGEAVCKQGVFSGIREVRSLCIRIARDYSGIAQDLRGIQGSVLILGAPGWGKTTLLRELARRFAQTETVAVVDERGELYPDKFVVGKHMDIMTGCSKAAGIEMLLRTMGPDCIAIDEITSVHDCEALVSAANCGVRLLATAHAASASDFYRRAVYKPLMEQHIIDTLLVLKRDKSYVLERVAV